MVPSAIRWLAENSRISRNFKFWLSFVELNYIKNSNCERAQLFCFKHRTSDCASVQWQRLGECSVKIKWANKVKVHCINTFISTSPLPPPPPPLPSPCSYFIKEGQHYFPITSFSAQMRLWMQAFDISWMFCKRFCSFCDHLNRK